MKVLVNGLGNIGTTLANLLVRYKLELEIDEIWVSKRKIHPWQEQELAILAQQGVHFCTHTKHANYPLFEDVIGEMNYVFEAASNGVGNSNRLKYEQLPNLIGSCAQGSEKGFGVSFMSGVNNDAIYGQKFVHVVSCNTHGSAALLRTFSGDLLENLSKADMVVVRRSEDLGNHERLVSANVVARHLNELAGTHHSVDVIDLFKTLNVSCDLTSSDITTPSQLMHAVRFNIELKAPISKSHKELIDRNPLIAQTKKFDSNVVFELGRRYGFNGRIFSHAIVLSENLLITDRSMKGWAFIPQEGNSIISTIHAYLLQTKHPNERVLIRKLVADLCIKEW
ncbi:MAG: hypothetical protein R2780_10545 [Crocinitomicaceae bacterium]